MHVFCLRITLVTVTAVGLGTPAQKFPNSFPKPITVSSTFFCRQIP